jgi:hypothetical protein
MAGPAHPLTAAQMREALWRHYTGRCAVLFEVSTDAQPEPDAKVPLRRRRQIDVLTVSRARRSGIGELDLLAIEIKVSRSDFLADVADPVKQQRWREVAQRHAYAAPEGLIRPGEIPAGSGLLTVAAPRTASGYHYYDVNWRVRAPRLGSRYQTPPWLTLAFAYRMSRAEAKLRGLASGTRDAGESAEDMRAAVAKARADTELLRRERDRAVNAAAEWKAAFAAAGGSLPCAHCGQPVRPVSLRSGHFSAWRHVTRSDDGGCDLIRGGRWVPVEPADGPEPMRSFV